MRTLIIGNLGYVGPILVKHLRAIYPSSFLSGYDIGYFINNYTDNDIVGDTLLNTQFFGDVRGFDENILTGYDSVVYLAAISNDPMGNIYEKPTLEINFTSAIAIAEKAKQKGVRKFIFASSCSVYGFADAAPRTEKSEVAPLTSYAKSKVFAEQGLKSLSDNQFTVTCLRFATACGYSDRLRLDLVLNDFVASAIVSNRIEILSDGSPWRPLIHVKDMARALEWGIVRKEGGNFIVVNAGCNEWNYQVKELAVSVKEIFRDVDININKNAPPDKRSYKVSFDLFKELAPNHQPQVKIKEAIEELKQGLEGINYSDQSFRNSSLIRLKTIQKLRDTNILDSDLCRVNR